MDEPKHYLVVDLEATCSDDGHIPKHEMEIIEIGAVLVSAVTLRSVAEHQTFVRPVRHQELTPFCTALTSIGQSDVDAAPPFREALKEFASWAYGFPSILFCSWGDFDRKQLRSDCAHHGVTYPFGSGHMNIKRVFARRRGLKKKPGMAQALAQVGLELSGTHHRGIDDARNIARLLPYALRPSERTRVTVRPDAPSDGSVQSKNEMAPHSRGLREGVSLRSRHRPRPGCDYDISTLLADMLDDGSGALRSIGEIIRSQGHAAAKAFLEELIAEGEARLNTLLEHIDALDSSDVFARDEVIMLVQEGYKYACSAEQHAAAVLENSPSLARTVSYVRAMAAVVEHGCAALLARARARR